MAKSSKMGKINPRNMTVLVINKEYQLEEGLLSTIIQEMMRMKYMMTLCQ
jgi:hypothetical protein